MNISRVRKIIKSVKELAIQYYRETGKPLGITGEIAEWEAARLLRLKLCAAREAGYDAYRVGGKGPKRIQIKGRRILANSKPGQRMGAIRFNHKWDSVILIELDEMYEPVMIHEALRSQIKKAVNASKSKRADLPVHKFRSISRPIWKKN